MFSFLINHHHLLIKAASPEVVAAVTSQLGRMVLEKTVVPAGHFLQGVICVFGTAEALEAGPMVVEKIKEVATTLSTLAEIHQGIVKLEQGQEKLLAGGVPAATEPVSESEAVRVFALMKALDDGERKRKAPLGRVFRLLVLEGLSQKAVAVKCRCSPALVSLRVREIERRMERPVTELRALASRLGEMDASVQDARARRIYQRGLTDDTEEEG